MTMMYFNGQSLGKKYDTKINSGISNDAQKTQEQKDREALRKLNKKKREARWKKLEERDLKRDYSTVEGMKTQLKRIPQYKKEKLNLIEKQKTEKQQKMEEGKEDLFQRKLDKALQETNHLARKHGLAEPNNPEALKHDRLHCYMCDIRLHQPDAYKGVPEKLRGLFGADEEVRTLCCWCFGKLGDEEINNVRQGEADKRTRLLVYNPEQIVQEDVDIEVESAKQRIERLAKQQKEQTEKMTKERAMYFKSKLKRTKEFAIMVENIKRDDLEDELHTELSFLKQFKTRYNACTEG